MRKFQTLRFLPVHLILLLSFFSPSCNERETKPLEEQVLSAQIAMLPDHSKNVGVSSATEPYVAAEKDTNVLLRVDTENITEDTKNEFVFISDDRSESSEKSSSPSEHIALVEKNMKIYWRAEALEPQSGVTVDVLGIFRKPEGGSEILEGVFRDPNKDGIIMGKIKNKKVEGMEYYNIMIRVNSETPKTFLIDPKIKMIN
ncbi:hypothetical protein SAMN06296241_2405 [Salinimicrobium sediminis]|uniref:Lipoprotein n=1 Tax=Salinimicrobium sediminis TaxID=1343891 RepID=A0A285X693_9FLAO|nr:hypothetical protein [Salinimicrobium sediminis]SOC80842.1 hypothetical protein SAMN06296241_2405 [Salinimicrobium sediminis]